MADLSVLIPARNEQFLTRTIEDVVANSRGDTEVIAVLDGDWPIVPIPVHPRVQVIYQPQPVGQRAATNMAAKVSTARYIMKLDAHCSLAEGFDVELMSSAAELGHDVTQVPRMYNLHAFDWVCSNGHRRYQGPEGPCLECGEPTTQDVIWFTKRNPTSDFMRFDRELHFQYWREYAKRPQAQGEIADQMCAIGACWFMERSRYWELGGLDETHGPWGQMGVEIACKSWLSGGRQVVNKRTWFAHMFRTQDGFKFPYPLSGSDVERARRHSRRLWMGGEWAGAKRPLSWLINHFAPVPDWENYKPAPQKGIIYYTCNTHQADIEQACRVQLKRASGEIPIVCVSREPTDYGDVQITLPGEPGPLQMHRQILAGLQASEAEFVWLCENDVLYHPSHFDYQPPRRDVYYYNTNVWKVWHDDGLAVWTDNLQQASGLCAGREMLLNYYTRRVEQIERDGFDRHYEPRGHRFYCHQRGGKYGSQSWQSEHPNICIRHDGTATRSKRAASEFRNPKYAVGFRTADEVPPWGVTRGRMPELLSEVLHGNNDAAERP